MYITSIEASIDFFETSGTDDSHGKQSHSLAF